MPTGESSSAASGESRLEMGTAVIVLAEVAVVADRVARHHQARGRQAVNG
jgi:hypothetical protein